jgi:hypothetical protein
MRWTWVAVLALVTGCDGIELEQLVKQHAARTRVANEPAGAHCPHGGTALESGLDLNDNGVLDDGEVTATEYACVAALTRKEPEAAGANCALGGQSVRTGVDVDGDGVLDTDEVLSTEYLCTTAIPDVLMRTQAVSPGEKCPNGGQVTRAGHDTNGNGELEDGEVTREVYACSQSKTPEAVLYRVRTFEPPPFICASTSTAVEAGLDSDGDGVLDDGEARARVDLCASPARVRVKLSPEPAGARCAAGGTRVVTGEDVNGDGEIGGNGEPTMETFVCQPLHTFSGNYAVKTAADLAALQSISHVQGNLTIEGTDLTEVVLPGLSVVEGQVNLSDNAQLTRVELPGLRFVGQDLQVSSHPLLETLVLGGAWDETLWVETFLHLRSNARLQSLSGLAFVSPRVGLGLEDNDALEYVPGQPGFRAVRALSGNVLVSGNDKLRALPLPNLYLVGGTLQIIGNASLQSLDGTNLATLGSDLWVGDNDSLQDLSGLSFLQVIPGWLSVYNNDALLTTEGFTSLKSLGGLSIQNNTSLQWVGDLPALQSLNYQLDVQRNPRLLGLRNMGALTSLGQLNLADNPMLMDLSPLASMQKLEDLFVERNPSLTSLGALASLREVMNVHIEQNANLTRFELGALQKVSMEFFVTDNPKLPTCLANALVTAVHTGNVFLRRISGNDDAATCGN